MSKSVIASHRCAHRLLWIYYFGYMRFYRFSTHDRPKPAKPHWPEMRTYNPYWEVINSTTGKLKAPKKAPKALN